MNEVKLIVFCVPVILCCYLCTRVGVLRVQAWAQVKQVPDMGKGAPKAVKRLKQEVCACT